MKVSRHAKIVELIGQYDVETQEELAELLNREGFQVTQATVSRDIRSLPLHGPYEEPRSVRSQNRRKTTVPVMAQKRNKDPAHRQ